MTRINVAPCHMCSRIWYIIIKTFINFFNLFHIHYCMAFTHWQDSQVRENFASMSCCGMAEWPMLLAAARRCSNGHHCIFSTGATGAACLWHGLWDCTCGRFFCRHAGWRRPRPQRERQMWHHKPFCMAGHLNAANIGPSDKYAIFIQTKQLCHRK